MGLFASRLSSASKQPPGFAPQLVGDAEEGSPHCTVGFPQKPHWDPVKVLWSWRGCLLVPE